MKTATRNFRIYKDGENKESIYVTIVTKDYEDELGAWLPKNQIRIINRTYHFGGLRMAEIELPVSLLPLFKSIHSEENRLKGAICNAGYSLTNVSVKDNQDGTFSLTGYDKERVLRGSFDCIKSLLQIKP